MIFVLALVTIMSVAGPAAAAERPDDLIEQWYVARDVCRGPVGAAREAACIEHNKLEAQIKSMGWCYGVPLGFTVDHRWRPCGK